MSGERSRAGSVLFLLLLVGGGVVQVRESFAARRYCGWSGEAFLALGAAPRSSGRGRAARARGAALRPAALPGRPGGRSGRGARCGPALSVCFSKRAAAPLRGPTQA